LIIKAVLPVVAGSVSYGIVAAGRSIIGACLVNNFYGIYIPFKCASIYNTK